MSDADFRRCNVCGNLNYLDRGKCWICETPLERATEKPAEAPAARAAPPTEPGPLPPPPTRGAGIPAWSVTAVTILCAGVFFINPGIAIILALVLVVPMLRLSTDAKRRPGRQRSTLERVLFVISSVIIGIILTLVVLVAAVGTFCLVCAATVDRSGTAKVPMPLPVVLASAAAVVVIAGLSYLIIKGYTRK